MDLEDGIDRTQSQSQHSDGPLKSLDSQELEQDLNEDIARLRTAWVREVCAPELLMYEAELVQDLKEQIDNQQGHIDDAGATDVEQAFSVSLYRLELDRLRYSLGKYLRTRLQKVQRDAMYIVTHPADMEGRISDREMEFAQQFAGMVEGVFNGACLDHLNAKGGFKDTRAQEDDQRMIEEPDLDTFVVTHTREDIGDVQIDEGEASATVTLHKDDLYMIRYRPVRAFVLQGQIDLI